MKRIALIHTVKPVLDTFENRLREAMPDEELLIHNLLDDFLATDPSPDGIGYFSKNNRKRLLNDIISAELTCADIIVVTCSTLTPIVNDIRPFISTPIIAIDDAMANEAVKNGKRIMVLATAQSTMQPTTARLAQAAAENHKEIILDSACNEPAYVAMKKRDMKTHDILVKKQAEAIRNYDVIVLAQASMAHLEADIEKLTNIPTMSSPERCIQHIKNLLTN